MRNPWPNRACNVLTAAKTATARRELVLLGIAHMNAWTIGCTRFSLQALRDGGITDEYETPPFERFWCLRNASNHRAAAVLVELQDSESVDAIAAEHGLTVRVCPSNPQMVMVTRSDTEIIWPRTAQGVRRNFR